MVEKNLKELEVTSIPDLIRKYGSIRGTIRNTGISYSTINKYQSDYNCEAHIIVNGRIMFARKSTPALCYPKQEKKAEYKFVDNKLVRV